MRVVKYPEPEAETLVTCPKCKAELAYIGSDCSSGYKCVADTPKECAEQIRDYFLNEWNNYEEE
jgi:hypothetical protein